MFSFVLKLACTRFLHKLEVPFLHCLTCMEHDPSNPGSVADPGIPAGGANLVGGGVPTPDVSTFKKCVLKESELLVGGVGCAPLDPPILFLSALHPLSCTARLKWINFVTTTI